jgi:hypothetical protein
VFSGEWSFRIRSWWREDEEVIVLGQLSAGGQVKQQFGSAPLSRDPNTERPTSIGDDLIEAASSAFAECATGFGVAARPARQQPVSAGADGARLADQR